MEIKTLLAAAGTSAALLLSAANAATLTIDEFNDAQQVEDSATDDVATSGSVGVTGSIFEERTVTIEASGGSNSFASASVEIDNGIATFNAESQVDFNAVLSYTTASPESIVLDGENERFQINVISQDDAGTFSFTVVDDMGLSATVTKMVAADQLGVTDFSFADLVGDAVDLTSIVEIAFEVEGGSDFDLSIEFLGITTDGLPPIPLPAGAPLLLSGLAGFAAFRKMKS